MQFRLLVLLALLAAPAAAEPNPPAVAQFSEELALCTAFFHIVAESYASESDPDARALARITGYWADHLDMLLFTTAGTFETKTGYLDAAEDRLRSVIQTGRDNEAMVTEYSDTCQALAADPQARLAELAKEPTSTR